MVNLFLRKEKRESLSLLFSLLSAFHSVVSVVNLSSSLFSLGLPLCGLCGESLPQERIGPVGREVT